MKDATFFEGNDNGFAYNVEQVSVSDGNIAIGGILFRGKDLTRFHSFLKENLDAKAFVSLMVGENSEGKPPIDPCYKCAITIDMVKWVKEEDWESFQEGLRSVMKLIQPCLQ